MKYVRPLLETLYEHRTFTLFWLGQSLSEIGTRLTGFGLSIWVYQYTHTVTQLSLVLFFTTLPGVLITPFVGAFIDNWNRRWTIIFSEIAAVLVTLTLALLLITDHLQLWHTYVSAFFTSVCGSFQMTGKAAALPLMVPSNQIGRANGLIQLSSAVGQLATPILAGVIIANFQFHSLLIIDLFTYLIGLFTLFIITIPQPQTSIKFNTQISVFFSNIIDGWKSISSHLFFIILLTFMTINSFVNGMTSVLINPLILSFSNAAIFGSVMSVAGCAMVAGSIVMSIWGGGEKSISALFMLCSLNSIGLIIAGTKPSILIITLGISLSFFTLPIILGINNKIWQTSFPSNIQGRVLALFYTLTGLGSAFGTLSASPLTDKILEPLLSFDGILATSIGRLIGIGHGRGIGFLMIIQGLIMFVISVSFYSYFAFKPIDEKLLAINGEPVDQNTTELTNSSII